MEKRSQSHEGKQGGDADEMQLSTVTQIAKQS